MHQTSHRSGRRRHCADLAVVVVIACILGPQHSPAVGADTASIDEIVDAWRARQERVRSFQFVWRQRAFDSQAWSRFKSERLKQVVPPREGLDLEPTDEDIEYTATVTLIVDGHRIRHEDDGHQRVGAGTELWKRVHTRVFDGETWTDFATHKTPDGLVIPQANLDSEYDGVVMDFNVFPLFWMYRMVDPVQQPSVPIDELRLEDEAAVHEGRQCLVLRAGSRALWVDPARDFAVVRGVWHYSDSGSIQIQLTVSYEEDAVHGWVPASWDFVYAANSGEVLIARDFTVLEHAINPEVSSSAFRLELPVDTLIIDTRDPDRERTYLQRAGQRLMEVEPGNLAYSELVERVRQREASEGRRWRGLWLLLGTTAAAALLLWLARRISRQRSAV